MLTGFAIARLCFGPLGTADRIPFRYATWNTGAFLEAADAALGGDGAEARGAARGSSPVLVVAEHDHGGTLGRVAQVEDVGEVEQGLGAQALAFGGEHIVEVDIGGVDVERFAAQPQAGEDLDDRLADVGWGAHGATGSAMPAQAIIAALGTSDGLATTIPRWEAMRVASAR